MSCDERMGGVMRRTRPGRFRGLVLACLFSLLQGGCGGGGGGDDAAPPAPLTGEAILEIRLVDGGHRSTPPAAPPGFRLLDIDLNEGTGGNYIWLYYRTGKADGSEGQPLSRIYTVDEHDREAPQGGVKLPVNLNANEYVVQGGRGPLWLYAVNGDSPAVRCIVVDNRTDQLRVYGPPEAAGRYRIEWVRELSSDGWSPPYDDLPRDVQDLNEGESSIFPPVYSDYIFIGVCRD